MSLFDDKYNAFLIEFGHERKMVLSTSENNRVSSRMMSVIRIDGSFYFQTDTTMRKYRQIKSNRNVALCIDNIQIEGVCEEEGHPLDNGQFCNLYQKCFQGSFDAYSSLKNERLFVIKPVFLERWIYSNGVPYIETFDVENREYNYRKYIGL